MMEGGCLVSFSGLKREINSDGKRSIKQPHHTLSSFSILSSTTFTDKESNVMPLSSSIKVRCFRWMRRCPLVIFRGELCSSYEEY
ncbi:hypothetical protein RIF29_38867 [Crotalaria pallida]|uniref:Uncharacterized protein n=1 Tax=Crotalaria pallida TaxID=3830 RepID=A0AAN9HP55_CROPI